MNLFINFVIKESILTIESDNNFGFSILDKRFYLDKLDIHIGDTKEKIGKQFPKSFNKKNNDRIEVRNSSSDYFIDLFLKMENYISFFLQEPDC